MAKFYARILQKKRLFWRRTVNQPLIRSEKGCFRGVNSGPRIDPPKTPFFAGWKLASEPSQIDDLGVLAGAVFCHFLARQTPQKTTQKTTNFSPTPASSFFHRQTPHFLPRGRSRRSTDTGDVDGLVSKLPNPSSRFSCCYRKQTTMALCSADNAMFSVE